MLKNFSKSKSGFTLIEMLVVVSVIAILSGVVAVVLNSSGSQGKARDAQRVADIKRIQTALELYFSDYREYPRTPASTWIRITGTTDLLTTALKGGSYMTVVPVDPLNTSTASNPCDDFTKYRYNYKDTTGNYYILTAIMEVATSDDISKCKNLPIWSSQGCSSGDTWSGTTDYCYGVQNP
ncbi:MAG: fimbrial protein pilin [uncultured bacterium]|nr:MAG: fimbrial protein pilin [uncultured bacterium]